MLMPLHTRPWFISQRSIQSDMNRIVLAELVLSLSIRLACLVGKSVPPVDAPNFVNNEAHISKAYMLDSPGSVNMSKFMR